MAEFKLDREKLKQAALLFIHIANNGMLGKTKLFKLLYYADFDHFERTGVPITGETYIRLDYGPFPEHGELILTQLEDEEAIKIETVTVGNYLKFTYQALIDVDISIFTADEIKTLIDVAVKWARHNATEMVAATHGEAPWIATAPKEPISYSLAYYRNKFGEMDEFGEEDIAKLVELGDVG
jgi:uncharacterized phage-associated protein